MLRLDRSVLPSGQFWGLLVTFTWLFLTGGSSRGDVQSLALLNPAMIFCCGAAMLTLKAEHWRGKKWLLASCMLVFFMFGCYVTPVPAQLYEFLRGPDNVSAIRATVGVSDTLNVLAIAPASAWQSLYFLFSPAAVLLFAIQLNASDLRLTVPVMIFFGTFSGMIGILQLVGSAGGPMYFYDITNNGSAVGLFANRNHAAVLLACLFPMLALSATKSQVTDALHRKKRLVAIATVIILVPLILVTGSRSGLLAAIIGLIGGMLVYISHRPSHYYSKTAAKVMAIISASTLLSLVFITIYFSRAEAIDRIFVERGTANTRADFWTSSVDLLSQYFPVGFGPGSFVVAFQTNEPIALLSGNYLNRLHNDWLETALTFGVPGLMLSLGAIAYYATRTYKLWLYMDGLCRSVALNRTASIVIAILIIASTSDYPLRTPAMMGFFALVLVWFLEPPRAPMVNKGLATPSSHPQSRPRHDILTNLF